MAERQVAFGPFVLDSRRGTLLRSGMPVAVSNKGFLLLRVLAEADGRAVTKAELLEAAWPDTTVEESNLTVQVAALRKALGETPAGEEWISTIPRIGYKLNRFPQESSPSVSLEKASLAVLPFNSLSRDPEQEYFALGLAEDLITDLSKVSGLIVIARNSSFTYTATPADLRLVAKELGVRYIVAGSVRRSAERVRINAELIDTTDNGHVWADRFDRQLGEIFALQDEVVGKILNALVEVLPSAKAVPRAKTANLDAYDLFVRGRALVTELSEDNESARPFLERSIEIDPGFAEAHAWLAISHHFAWAYWNQPREPHQTLARRSARQAVLVEPENAVAHGILGDVLIYDHRPDEGEAELASALRLNPNHADAWTFLGQLKAFEGQAAEGIELIRKALRLNPRPPGWYHWLLGLAEYAAGRYEDAIGTLSHEATRRMGSRRILAASLAQVGRIDEAKLEAHEFLRANAHFSMDYWARTQPFRHDADRQHFIDGYLKAGLPR